MPHRCLCSLFAAVILVTAAAPSRAAAEAARPDIVVMLTDDQGQLDSTVYGNDKLRTPHMQRLADAGMTFTRAFVPSPSCAPARAALLTSMMPARNGAEPNHSKPHADIKKWPAYFQQLGYEVVAFGKVSHYRHTADYGFDHFAHDTYHDHAWVGAALDFLKERATHKDRKPLCLMVGSNWPHVPWPETPEGYDPAALSLPAGSVDTPVTRQWRARYAAAVTRADNDLGAVYDAARKSLGDDTVFLFSSDHGTQWPFGKWNLYDSGIRVPLVVVWPGVVKPASRSDAMVCWIDFLPTLLEVAGGTPPPPDSPQHFDGRSFAAVLRGSADEHREEIFTTHSGDGRWNVYPMRSVRTDRFKYIRNLHPEFAYTTHIDLGIDRDGASYFSSWEKAASKNLDAAAIIKRYHTRPAEELYDLQADPHEQHNLAADPAHADTLAKLRAQVTAWMTASNDEGKVYAEPRLLSDPTSYGPKAEAPGKRPKK